MSWEMAGALEPCQTCGVFGFDAPEPIVSDREVE